MTVMVTGMGFNGAYVVRDLLAAGKDVLIYGYCGGNGNPHGELPDIDLLDDLIEGDVRDRVNIVVGDVTDLTAVAAAVEKYEVRSIVHLAAKLSSAAEADPPSAVDVNVGGLTTMLDVGVLADLDRVVFASTIALFTSRSIGRGGVIDDDSLCDPDGIYGATKFLSEKIAQNYAERTGLKVTGLRLSRVYGYGEHIKAHRGAGSSWMLRLLRDAATGITPVEVPFGDKRFDFFYVEDCSLAFIKALDAHLPVNGKSYTLQGDYRSVREAGEYVQQALPESKITLVGGLQEASLPGASHAWALPFDASRAERDLGIRSSFTMEEGLLRTMNMYRRSMGLPLLKKPAAL